MSRYEDGHDASAPQRGRPRKHGKTTMWKKSQEDDDFYGNDSPEEPSEVGSDTPSTPSSERRRSERVKREKPDYYDALDFDTKRRADKFTIVGGSLTPTRPRRSVSDKIPYRSPRMARYEDGQDASLPQRGRPRKHGRATMWKKGQEDDEYYVNDRRRKKKKHSLKDQKENIGKDRDSSGNDPEELFLEAMDELAPEKSLQCQVSLAEINRRLAGVIGQPM